MESDKLTFEDAKFLATLLRTESCWDEGWAGLVEDLVEDHERLKAALSRVAIGKGVPTIYKELCREALK